MVAEKEAAKLQSDFVNESDCELEKMMGFSGFGGAKGVKAKMEKAKAAQQFDVEAMAASVAKSAQERNVLNSRRLEDEGRESERTFIIPSSSHHEVTKTKVSDKSDNNEDSDIDDDVYGPPVPKGEKEKN